MYTTHSILGTWMWIPYPIPQGYQGMTVCPIYICQVVSYLRKDLLHTIKYFLCFGLLKNSSHLCWIYFFHYLPFSFLICSLSNFHLINYICVSHLYPPYFPLCLFSLVILFSYIFLSTASSHFIISCHVLVSSLSSFPSVP